MELKVIEQSDELTHVALSGRLDIMGVQEIESEFLACTASAKKPTMIDIADVSFVSSFGLGMIMKCAAILRANNLKAVLLNPQPMVAQLLEISNIGLFIAVAEDKDTALELLERG